MTMTAISHAMKFSSISDASSPEARLTACAFRGVEQILSHKIHCVKLIFLLANDAGNRYNLIGCDRSFEEVLVHKKSALR